MEDTLNQIHRISNERFNLYRSAGKHQLSPAQRDRLTQINNQLPLLWDQHRRELAATNYPRRSYASANVA